jgi:hypothetical protein
MIIRYYGGYSISIYHIIFGNEVGLLCQKILKTVSSFIRENSDGLLLVIRTDV